MSSTFCHHHQHRCPALKSYPGIALVMATAFILAEWDVLCPLRESIVPDPAEVHGNCRALKGIPTARFSFLVPWDDICPSGDPSCPGTSVLIVK